MPSRIVLLGAGGYIGGHLASRLLNDPRLAGSRFTFCDRHFRQDFADPRVSFVQGDFSDPATLAEICAVPADVVFHLAGILGGAAESDYALSRRVNIDGTLALFEALRDPARAPRVVFASSIAVFGPPLPARIDDDTQALPTMTYGAQKRMMEIALEQFSARGWIDGLALRLPGIVARRDVNPALRSSFLNQMFHAIAAGEDITLPVSLQGTTWLLSVQGCIEALVHAAFLPAALPGRRRALTLPSLRVSIGQLLDAIRRRFPDSRSEVRVEPDAGLEAQFTAWPVLSTSIADSLGFRHDGDIDALVRRAVEPPVGRGQ